jgi:hypothetical protein
MIYGASGDVVRYYPQMGVVDDLWWSDYCYCSLRGLPPPWVFRAAAILR